MAITAKTIVTNPAAAAVAAWTILGVSIMSTHVDSTPYDATSLCESTEITSAWQARGEVQCLMDHGFHAQARRQAIDHLKVYPRDEGLYNQLGIVNIQMERYEEASVVLARALREVRPTTATLENNLVWSTLWVGNLDIEGQRRIYRRALEREPELCEALHTGMMVEWGAASAAHSFEQVDAIREFTALMERYLNCQRGSEPTDYDRVLEDLSVVTALVDIDRMLGVTYNLRTSKLAQSVSLRLETHQWDTYDACEHAIPSALGTEMLCRRVVDDHAGLDRVSGDSRQKVIVQW